MTRALARALWLVPPTFALHVAEEAPGFARRFEHPPGRVTGLLFPPLHWRLTSLAGAAGLLGHRSGRAALLLAGAVHTEVVARQVYEGGGRRVGRS